MSHELGPFVGQWSKTKSVLVMVTVAVKKGCVMETMRHSDGRAHRLFCE
jgi:hypothetical protein